MAQNQSEPNADAETIPRSPVITTQGNLNLIDSQDPHESTKVEIELIRRPNDSGIFGTVSFKVSVSGVNVQETLQTLERTTQQMETRFGQAIRRRIDNLNLPTPTHVLEQNKS